MVWPWGARSRIAGAERRLRDHPSPETYLQLARTYLAAGVSERAVEALKRGREAFPEATSLASLYEDLCWSALRRRAHELEERIEADPRPRDVIALAHLLAEMGDLTRALSVMERGTTLCAEDLEVHLEMARLRWRLWRREYLSADGAEALRHVQCILGLDDGHVEALFLLAALYLQIGAFSEALTCLDRLASLEEGALEEAARERVERYRAFAEAGRDQQTEHDTEALLDAVERNGRPLLGPRDLDGEGREHQAEECAAEAPGQRTAVVEEAQRIAAEPAVRAVLVEDRRPATKTLAFEGPEAGPETQAALHQVVSSALAACQRIGIGRLTRAMVSSPGGTVGLAGFPHEVVACLWSPACHPDEAEARLDGLAATVAAPGGREA